jgi:hypothetical protein
MTATTPSRPVATGGLLFAASIMVLTGLFQFFQGIAAIAKDQIFVSTPNYMFTFDTTAWGWIHLIIGLVIAIIGYFVFIRATWARFVAIILVAFQAVSNFLFLPHYPLWALTIIALDIFVIWALTVAPARSGHDGYDPQERTQAQIDGLTARRTTR